MVPNSHMGCLVFVRASGFMTVLRCIFGPGHFKHVAPKSVQALYVTVPLQFLQVFSLSCLLFNIYEFSRQKKLPQESPDQSSVLDYKEIG